MFDWLAKKKVTQPTRPWVRPRVVPALYELEARVCPAAPLLMGFNVALLQGQTVQLTGMVMDENPGSVSIRFSGAASGTTTANAMGLFQLTTTASQLGTIYAQATDNQGLTSQIAQSLLSAPTPNLTLTLAHGSGKMVTLGGQVTAGAPGNLTVTFTGQVAATTTSATTGTYSYTAEASALGTVSATVTDIWGQHSNAVQVAVASNAPTVSFTVMQGADRAVCIQGQVMDESPGGITVTLSGAVSATVTTTSSGAFYYAGAATGLGTITASAADCWGLTGSTNAILTNSAPAIVNFQAVGTNNYWTISGQVTDEFVTGLIVHLTSSIAALDGVDVTVSSDGWFRYTVQLQAGDSGELSAITTDWWGVQSATATTTIA